MRVLLVSQHFWPETFRINDVAQSLRAQGCEVTVLTGKPNYPEGRIFPGYERAGVQREEHEGLEIVRVPLRPRGEGGARRLVLNYLSFIASVCWHGSRALRGRPFDVVFVYGTSPILQAIGAVLLRRLKGAALVTWVQDLWPQSLEATGYVRNPRALAAVARAVRWIYARCDLLLVQSPSFVAPVKALAGATPVAVHLNPGEAPTATDGELPPALAALPWGRGFNIVFAGNLGQAQGLDTVLEAAALTGSASGIRWILVGSGARSEWLAEQVRTRGLSQVLLPGRFAASVMPALLARADALLVSLVPGEAMSQTIPSKVQSYLCAGRPILASVDGEGARVVREAGAGLDTPAGDARALAEAARSLAALDARSLHRMGESGREYHRRHFDPAQLARDLMEHFERAREARRGKQ